MYTGCICLHIHNIYIILSSTASIFHFIIKLFKNEESLIFFWCQIKLKIPKISFLTGTYIGRDLEFAVAATELEKVKTQNLHRL